jgi:hypothetical protein
VKESGLWESDFSAAGRVAALLYLVGRREGHRVGGVREDGVAVALRGRVQVQLQQVGRVARHAVHLARPF